MCAKRGIYKHGSAQSKRGKKLVITNHNFSSSILFSDLLDLLKTLHCPIVSPAVDMSLCVLLGTKIISVLVEGLCSGRNLY